RIRPILVLPRQQSFTIRRPSSLTRRRSVRLSSIAEDSLLLPPVGVWAVSQSQCGRSPSQVGSASLPWYAFISPTSYCATGPSTSDSRNRLLIFYPEVKDRIRYWFAFTRDITRLKQGNRRIRQPSAAQSTTSQPKVSE